MRHSFNASRGATFRLGTASAIALAISTMPAMAQEESGTAAAEDASVLPRVLVTAQKRVEDPNTVPMSISVATADQLNASGITQPKDLVKLSPSFNYADSILGTPIYTLRGVGFADISLGGRPTVSVYVDEAPIPFAIETRGAQIDLERVEILKGPQGTLFGQNSTGGAINYIAAKPTDTFQAGANLSYGNFNALDLGGFISGPLSDKVSARLAVERSTMDDWQDSYTTSATNGSVDFTNARFSLAWEPSSDLSTLLTIGGFVDNSDTTAGQVIEVRPNIPGVAEVFIPGLLDYPLAPEDATAADFTPGEDYERDNQYLYANFRADYEFGNGVTLTSLTSFSEYDEDRLVDTDATTLRNLSVDTTGSIESFSQELRLGSTIGDRGNWLLGVSYADDEVLETEILSQPESTVAFIFFPGPAFETSRDINNQEATTTAIFASADYDIADQVNLYGGVRFTDAQIDHEGCSADAGDGVTAALFTGLWDEIRDDPFMLPPITPIEPGGCFSVDETFTPGLVVDELDEDNVSWRVGLDWTPSSDLLLYANVSEGFKAGSFPTLAASLQSQLEPATQESLLAYEVGFKATLLNDTMQLNGAVFQYDYEDKQILGQVADPIFGTLLRLINIPESEILGLELDALWVPVDGLTLKGGASFIDSEIGDGFMGFGPFGEPEDFSGQSFPQTPEWHFVADVNYEWDLNRDYRGFVGGGFTYQSATNNSLGEDPILEIDNRGLLDMRAGIASSDDRWRLSIWGRNMTDEYYWTATQPNLDTTVRYAAMPATYGIELDLRFD